MRVAAEFASVAMLCAMLTVGVCQAQQPASPSDSKVVTVRIADSASAASLLAHGDVDDNVHPANTLRVADQLIRNNKPFDMLIMPNVEHGIADHPYFMKRLWDYFVSNLRHEQPPADFVLHRPEE